MVTSLPGSPGGAPLVPPAATGRMGYIAGLLLAPLRWLRRHPFLAAALLLLAVAAALTAVQCWALYDFREAERALDEDRLADASARVGFCLSVWPWSADTHFLAARICRTGGAYPAAESQLDECRRLEGATARVQLEMLLLRAQRGEVDQVGAGLLYAADREPAHEREILEAVARGHMTLLRYVPAAVLLDRCLKKYPNDIRALDWHGQVMERLQRQDNAVKDYQRAIELSPGNTEVRLRLAGLYLDQFDPVQAEPHLKALEKSIPARPDFLLALARCRFQQGAVNESCTLLDRVLTVWPDLPTALVYRGKIELQAAPPRAEAAEAYFRRALKAAPNDAAAHNALYDSLRAQPGREAEAQAELDRYNELVAAGHRIEILLISEVEESVHEAGPAYELGKLYVQLGEDDLAVYWLRTAEKRDPDHKPTHALLADLCAKKGDTDEAARERTLASR